MSPFFRASDALPARGLAGGAHILELGDVEELQRRAEGDEGGWVGENGRGAEVLETRVGAPGCWFL